MVRIEAINTKNKGYINQANDPFQIFGKLHIAFVDGKWVCEEEYFDTVTSKRYEDEAYDLEALIQKDDQTIFFALEDDEVLGEIVIHAAWNKYCHIDLIMLKEKVRGQAIGKMLLDHAQVWAIERDLKGFSLETQDINLGACKFYFKQGFEIGGINQRLYHHFDTKDELAIFFYKEFEEDL